MTDEDLRQLFHGAVSEMRRHFDATSERLEKRIDIVAEGVSRLDQKLDRTAAEIRDEMRRGFRYAGHDQVLARGVGSTDSRAGRRVR